MNVLIKGAEMPKTCEECQSTLGLFAKECPLFAEFPKEFDYDPEIGNNRRYANCPLVEVPGPHGRLIDADKYFNKVLDEANGINDKELAENFAIAGEAAPSICPRCGAIMDGKQDVCKFV